MSGLGYRLADERRAELQARAKPLGLMSFSAPPEIDHRGWLNVENQGPIGSCVGNALASVLECCNYIATAGGVVQLSRMFAYLESQKASGYFGSDNGATIDGAALAASRVGICLEATMPYPNPVRYVTTIPQAATVEAAGHRLKTHAVMRSYADVFNFLGSGVGAVEIGINWTQGLAQCSGVAETNNIGGRSLGGHALALVGYSKRQDSSGRQYIWLVNSHGRQWGNQGWAEIAPNVIDYWLRNGETMIGFSDLESFGPRTILSYEGMVG